MQLLQSLLPLAALVSTALSKPVKNTTQEFNIKTVVIPGQSGKASFNNLWLNTYHTGAGLDDAVFTTKRSGAVNGYLNATGTKGAGKKYSNLLFDFGSDFPWGLVQDSTTTAYAAWQPSRIDAGAVGNSTQTDGFYINSNGIQWTTSPSAPGGSDDAFGGWLVCNWWHLEPQLFFAIAYYKDFKVPANCARVQLQPVYI